MSNPETVHQDGRKDRCRDMGYVTLGLERTAVHLCCLDTQYLYCLGGILMFEILHMSFTKMTCLDVSAEISSFLLSIEQLFRDE